MVVYWDLVARRQVKGIYDYYLRIAGIRTAKKYRKEILISAERLRNFPRLGIVEIERKNIEAYRSIVVKKHYKIIYLIEEQRIFIAAVWDVRQDPAKLKTLIQK